MTRLIIGVDLGGTKMNAAAVDESGKLLSHAREKTLPQEGADAVINRMAGLVKAVAAQAGGQPEAICVGVPGSVDDGRGVVDKAPNLGWQGVPLAQKLSSFTGGARVFLDNDVRVAVLGEHAYGVGRGTRSMVGVFVGTGIGGGVVVDGQLHLGLRGAAGELGHMCIDPDGPKCPCGNRGCAEAFASRTSMERELQRLVDKGRKSVIPKILKKEGRERLTSSVVAQALEAGDKPMLRVFKRAQEAVGVVVANVVNLLDPEVVVIGGGLAERMGEAMVARIRETAQQRYLLQRDRDRVRIVATELKDKAAPMGAAFVARRRMSQA
jgi:glucokinase